MMKKAMLFEPLEKNRGLCIIKNVWHLEDYI